MGGVQQEEPAVQHRQRTQQALLWGVGGRERLLGALRGVGDRGLQGADRTMVPTFWIFGYRMDSVNTEIL